MIRRAVFVTCAVLLCLRAVVCAATGPPPRPGPLHVILRTKDDLYVGHDLRYGDGTFRLRQEAGEARIPANDVAHVTFVRRGREWPMRLPPRLAMRLSRDAPRDAVVGLAVLVVILPKLDRFRPALEEEDGARSWDQHVFYLPGEKPVEQFPMLARRVVQAELVARLCAETVARCLKAGQFQAAAGLFAKAEEQARGKNDEVAFVHALMRAAALMKPDPRLGRFRALQRLREAYPAHTDRLDRFKATLERLRGGPPRGPGTFRRGPRPGRRPPGPMPEP